MAATSPKPAGTMPWKMFALTWLGLTVLLILASLNRIAAREFFDPDDFMRLVQVRDLVAGQHWFDLSQYRLNPPQGTPMHWSRLVDAPLALVIVLLTPLLGSYNAETVALVLVPMVTLGCVMGLVMRIAASVLSREAAVMAGVCAVMIPAVLAQMNPLRIDHHGWQIACVLLAAASPSSARANRPARWLAWPLPSRCDLDRGLADRRRLWRDPGRRLGLVAGADRRIVWFMASLAVSLEALFLLTRGPAAFYPWCDSIASAHIAFFLIAAAGIALAARFGPVRRGFALGALAVSGAIAAVVFGADGSRVSWGAVRRARSAGDQVLVRAYRRGQPGVAARAAAQRDRRVRHASGYCG